MQVGLTGASSLVVTDVDTAVALGSGDVAVLGTPRVVALAEAATVAAVADSLDPGTTTVGTRVDIRHLRPSAVGATVRATAMVTAVHERKLTFTVSVLDGEDEVARGIVERAVVDRAVFSRQR